MIWSVVRAACRRFYRSELALLFLVQEQQRKKSAEKGSPLPDVDDKLSQSDLGDFFAQFGFRHADQRKDKHQEFWYMRHKNIAAYALKSRRPYMEDRFSYLVNEAKHFRLFGVFDGHGGQYVASYIEENLLQNIARKYLTSPSNANIAKLMIEETEKLDAEMQKITNPDLKLIGSTALFGLIINNMLYLANVGDCRAAGISLQKLNIKELTVDHKPNYPDELDRIKKAGGTVTFWGVWRVGGILAVSRALGDFRLKEPGWLIARPDVFEVDLSRQRYDLLLLASDGFWDVFRESEVLEYLATVFAKDANNNWDFATDSLLRAAQSLVQAAYAKGALDNITVMLVKV